MRRSHSGAALAVALSGSVLAAAHGATLPVVDHAPSTVSADVQTVQWHPYWHHRYWHHRYWHHRRRCYYHPGACY